MRTDDGEQFEWFDVTQGLRQGSVLSPFYFHVCLAAPIHGVLASLRDVPVTLKDLFHVPEDLGGDGVEIEPLSCGVRGKI